MSQLWRGWNTLLQVLYNVPLEELLAGLLRDQLQTEVQGGYRKSISNPNLTWETSVQTGVGIDLTMFNRKLDRVWTFQQLTRDLIEGSPLPLLPVLVATYGNVGRVLTVVMSFQHLTMIRLENSTIIFLATSAR